MRYSEKPERTAFRAFLCMVVVFVMVCFYCATFVLFCNHETCVALWFSPSAAAFISDGRNHLFEQKM